MLIEINKLYRIRYNPRCSSRCVETCDVCRVETSGVYTGRNWVDKNGVVLYELKYMKDGNTRVGIFNEREISSH